MALPRVDIVRGAITHSVTLVVKDIAEAIRLSNDYAPKHLILQVNDTEKLVNLVDNTRSVFISQWTPESVGDYSASVNHSLRESSLLSPHNNYFPSPIFEQSLLTYNQQQPTATQNNTPASASDPSQNTSRALASPLKGYETLAVP